MNLPYAHKINFWKSSSSDPGKWIEKAKNQIRKMGGSDIHEGFGCDDKGNSAFILAFQIEENKFKILWPVLPTLREEDVRAARVQAATILYHDVKAKSLSAIILGTRNAFMNYLMLPDGRNMGEVSDPELLKNAPQLLLK